MSPIVVSPIKISPQATIIGLIAAEIVNLKLHVSALLLMSVTVIIIVCWPAGKTVPIIGDCFIDKIPNPQPSFTIIEPVKSGNM